ncbi:beta-ketoacyl-[acyl-carrier-protein] synthase family protein [Nocardia arthritidis]|uniref:Beta-ketoacyl-ACP synthase II n=1 Tax=Nocardia arthritidis TaxID=228602 RepID=A0A6G9YAH2_9NOCA|nr:beta-ketoacyl-[acyl-carrier-protein] synthase family protein [Nocardia arthritidis]QIS10043.1 beta-ketoacyl-ACP synthase II [Nocardia arthritidis]
MTSRRVVITGIEVVAPGGNGIDEFWKRICSAETATRQIDFFDPGAFRSRIAAQCDFDPAAAGLTPQEIRRLDRAAQFALVCARRSIIDSGLGRDTMPAERTGVCVGTAVGCTMNLEGEYVVLSNGGRRWLVDADYAVPHLYDFFVPSSMAAEIARDISAEGPVTVVSDGCTSGLDAVGHAVELIREGAADIMISGGTDAPISPVTVACFDAIKATSSYNDDPAHAARPFDRTRNGFVLGEGAAIFVLEEFERARARGARIYAEIAGFSSRSNAYHMTALRPDGVEMSSAIDAALAEARINAEQIDYVNAHGTATKQNDVHETAAFKRSLGAHAYHVPISSIKPIIGHSLGAVGSIEIAACALARYHGVVPPTANLNEADPALDLDYVPLVAREKDLNTILTVGSGFGGFQSAMVLTAGERATA